MRKVWMFGWAAATMVATANAQLAMERSCTVGMNNYTGIGVTTKAGLP